MTLEVADHTIHQRVRDIIAEHHPALLAAGVTVTVLMSRKELKLHGVKAYAIARICSQRERAVGNSDAMITIDSMRWNDLEEDTQTAILDHELSHFQIAKLITAPKDCDPGRVIVEPQTGDKKVAACDDYERPKLKTRPHDHEHGWFDDIAKRHGAASIEVQQARVFAETELGQLVMFGGSERAATGTDGGKAKTATKRAKDARLRSVD